MEGDRFSTRGGGGVHVCTRQAYRGTSLLPNLLASSWTQEECSTWRSWQPEGSDTHTRVTLTCPRRPTDLWGPDSSYHVPGLVFNPEPSSAYFETLHCAWGRHFNPRFPLGDFPRDTGLTAPSQHEAQQTSKRQIDYGK